MDKLGTSPSARKVKPPRQYREVRGQLKELEIKYEASVQDEEKAYNRALQEIADALRYELLEIIGPTKRESHLRSISIENSDRQDSNNAAVTCQPHDATLQAIGAKEACVPKGMPENRHTSPTTTPVSVSARSIAHIHACLLNVIVQMKENIARTHGKETTSG
jgi:hypothetical protein